MPDGSKSHPEATGWTHASLLTDLKRIAGPSVARMRAAAPRGRSPDAWYHASYPIFVAGRPLTSLDADDFLRVVAYAYTWVATIPKKDPRSALPRVQHAIAEAKQTEARQSYNPKVVREKRRVALCCVQSALGISASVVIPSKVLHFLDPEFAPMIDGNVAKAWTRLVRTTNGATSDWSSALKSAGGPRVKRISRAPSVTQYLAYWELAYQFRLCDPSLSYRELDLLMFCYGKQL